MAKDAPVLDLGKLAKRPKVRIDGKLYELRTNDEFIYRARQHNRKFQRLGALMTKRRQSDAEQKEQSRLLNVFVREVLIAPDAVHAALEDVHRAKILITFTNTTK